MISWRFSIEKLFQESANWWRLLRFLRLTAILGSVILGMVLLFGAAVVARWITSPSMFTGGLAVLLLVSGLAWMGMGVVCAVEPEDRPQIASALERKHPWLLDRLNTLVFLRSPTQRQAHPYTAQIEQQTREVLARNPPRPVPISVRPLLMQCAVLGAVLLATLLFYGRYHPLARLRQPAQGPGAPPADEKQLEIPPIPEPPAAPKEDAPWGEIRITRPGSDLRATPLDVVPLRIEAASNRPVNKIEWLTAINGGPETPHALSVPKDSRFAAYTPDLDLQALGAKEWDVVGYYAGATAADGTVLRSELYYVEVLPFREELERVAGEKPGPGESPLEQLTAMIQRQEEVIRQTRPRDREPAADRKARTRQLAQEESDLGKAARRLSAEMTTGEDQRETAPIARSLQEAQSALGKSEQSLRQENADEALKSETSALAALAAARKQTHDYLARHLPPPEKPESQAAASKEKPEEGAAKPEGSDAAALKSALDRRIAELRKIEAAPQGVEQAQVEKTAAQTKDLLAQLEKHGQQEPQEEKPSGLRKKLTPENRRQLESKCDKLCQNSGAAGRKETAGEVREGLQELSKAMESDAARQRSESARAEGRRRLERLEKREKEMDFVRKYLPNMIQEQRKLEQEAKRGERDPSRLAPRQQAQEKTLRSLQENNPQALSNCQGECSRAGSAMGQAARAMQSGNPNAGRMAGKAADELQKIDDSLGDELTKNRLAQASELRRALGNEIEGLQQGQQSGGSAERLRQAASESRPTTEGLKRLAEDESMEGLLGRGLRESLSDEKKRQIDDRAEQVLRAASPEGQRQAAGPLQTGLQEVAKAFDGGPQGRSPGKQASPLVPQGQQAIEQGLRQLQSLNQRRSGGQPRSQQGETRLGREAVTNLRSGIDTVYGDNESGQDVLDKVEKDLKRPERPVDLKLVQTLLRQIAAEKREVAPSGEKSADEAKKTHIDPSRLPPAYRKSIETYFQKLSEER